MTTATPQNVVEKWAHRWWHKDLEASISCTMGKPPGYKTQWILQQQEGPHIPAWTQLTVQVGDPLDEDDILLLRLDRLTIPSDALAEPQEEPFSFFTRLQGEWYVKAGDKGFIRVEELPPDIEKLLSGIQDVIRAQREELKEAR